FGDFRVFFVPVDDGQLHTYRIDTFLAPLLMQDPPLPLTRTLYLAENRTIDPPSPRLLVVHRAIAQILHLSAAGQYIDRILRDAEEHGIQADGSTELGRLVRLGLGALAWAPGRMVSVSVRNNSNGSSSSLLPFPSFISLPLLNITVQPWFVC
ncbi:hypothetical protein C8A01DRAFT_15553, partial [Parachaetomium inaequale]